MIPEMGFGIFGIEPPCSNNIDDSLQPIYQALAEAPEMASIIENYNKLASIIGLPRAASQDELIDALKHNTTFAYTWNFLAMAKQHPSHPGTTRFWIQGNPTHWYGRRVARHEMLHLAAMLGGQTDTWFRGRILHEIAVQLVTTPELAVIKGAGLLYILATTSKLVDESMQLWHEWNQRRELK